MKRKLLVSAGVIAALLIVWVAIAWPREQKIASSSPAAFAPTPANIAPGAYLAQA
ncbi:MAG: cytochrome c, partial [Bdellovibrionales bacterium]|nr:cytochrome c [Massilia sp.]